MDYSDYNARYKGTYSSIWTSTGKCVFCDLRDKYIIDSNKGAVLTVNIFPYINGHLLVIPKKHIESFLKIDNDTWHDMHEMAKLGVKLLKKEMKIKDIHLILRASHGNGGDKSVPHAHMLILPYEDGLIEWHYKEITVPPIDLAKRLRSANK